MVRAKGGKARGILNPKTGEKKFRLDRYLPSPDLACFVEHYWGVRWDLAGEPPYRSETLSYPSVHLVFQKGKTAIFGVVTGKFSILLEDAGEVFAIKFRPGAFYPFVKKPVSDFTNRNPTLEETLGWDSHALEEAIFSREEDSGRVELVEDLLRQHLPEQDENIELVNRVIDLIAADRSIIKVEDIVARLYPGKRTLQRLFSQYVGVSPKWVIKRYRLHEAAEQLAQGQVADWAQLAIDLGYFDQAHFIKDFKALVGKTPAEYAREIQN